MRISTTKTPSIFHGVIAHRGARERAPENTLPAFEQALRDGADAIEVDVQFSKDGELVVIHDDTLERTTNGTGKVSDYTLAELKELDAGSWFGPEFAGTKIPTLRESLEWAKGRTRIDIEVKKSSAEVMSSQQLFEVIRETGMEADVAVTSFSRKLVEDTESRYPHLQTGLLASAAPMKDKALKAAGIGAVAGLIGGAITEASFLGALGGSLVGGIVGAAAGYLMGTKPILEAAKSSNVDAFLPHWVVGDSRVVKAAKGAGKDVTPYTVNNSLVAKIYDWRGADGIITDRPHQFS